MEQSVRVADPFSLPDVPQCPAYSPAERRADRMIHIIGVSSAALAGPALLIFALYWHGVSSVTFASSVYAFTLIGMLAISAAYHTNEDPRWRAILRRSDHAAIFAKIAGTFTPIIVLHGGPESVTVLSLLWLSAIAGMLIKLYQPPTWDRFAVGLYLALAWGTVIYVLPVLMGLSPAGFRLVLTGGVIYTLGVIFYLWDSLPFQNAIWHFFVLVATALCFTAILMEIGIAGTV